MIIGLGIDIIEVNRIRSSFERFGEQFTRRILRPSEVEYCLSHKDPAPFFAARFAAKEAVSKAFATGIGAQLGWQDMEVLRYASGQPHVVLHGEGLALMRQLQGHRLHLSLSHTKEHATAVAVLEGWPAYGASVTAELTSGATDSSHPPAG